MAITIHQQLDYLTPVYNINPFTIESSYNDEENFYYLLYIVDADGTFVSSRQPKDVNGLSIYDPNKITKNKVSYNFNPSITGQTDNSDLFYQYKVSYGSISDGSYDSVVNSNVINGFPFNFQIDDDWDITDYFLNNTDAKFLTDFDESKIVLTKDDYYTFNYINGNFGTLGTSSPYRFMYTFYKEDGSVHLRGLNRTTSTPTISTSSFNSTPERIIQTIPVGPQNLLGVTFNTSSVPIYFNLPSNFFDDVKYYTINAEQSGGAHQSKTYTVELKCKANHTNYQIFYKNKFSGFDAITFNHGNTTEYSSKINTFRKDPYGVVNNKYTYTQGNRGLDITHKTSQKKLIVFSDIIFEEHFPIYESFFNSPTHYLYKDGKIIPLVLTSNKMEIEDKMNRNLYQIKFEFDYSNKTNITL